MRKPHAGLGRALAALAVGLPLLVACGKSPPKAAGQVLARVNDQDVTVLELNAWMAAHPMAGESGDTARQTALDALVDQEVLVQKALKMKLDHDPDVSLAIDMARRQILAGAAAARLLPAAQPAEPTPAQIHAFFLAHAQWFGARKLYDTIAIELSTDALSAALRQALDQSKTPDQTLRLLNASRIEYRASPMQIAPERLPPAVQPALGKMNPGDILSMQQGKNTTLLQLVGTKPAPVAEADASPVIREFLLRSRNRDDLGRAWRSLKQEASISYVRRFTTQPGQQGGKTAQGYLNMGVKGL